MEVTIISKVFIVGRTHKIIPFVVKRTVFTSIFFVLLLPSGGTPATLVWFGSPEGGTPMLQAVDYRKHAEECVEIARTAPTQAQRTMLLHIADTWLRLAKDASENWSKATGEKSQ